MTTAADIDREVHGAIRSITVQATSSDGSTATQTFNVTINDLDEFDVGLPTDTDVTANEINENVAIGTTVGITANAFDLDATNNTIAYSLTSNPDGLFAIDPNTGVVTTAADIDREAHGATRRIAVQATSSDGSTATQTFNIAINDLDEFDVTVPSDVESSSNVVAEDAAVGTAVGITALASDADATTNSVTYTLDEDAGGLFAIDSSTGEVTVAGTLDFETWTWHTIIVRATSEDGSQAVGFFTIDVTDVNEYVVGPISDTAAVDDFVLENSASGVYVGITAFAVDPDGTATVTYSLDNDAQGRFSIDSRSGMVSTLRSLDFETSGQHNVTVRASSSDGSFQTADFLVLVGDVNESPVAMNDYYATSFIDRLVISVPGMLVNDSDPDGDVLSVVLLSLPSSGELIVNRDGSFTYTPVPGYIGEVRFAYAVTDGLLQSSGAIVTINVIVPTNVPAPETGGSGGGTHSASVSAPVADSTPDATAVNTAQLTEGLAVAAGLLIDDRTVYRGPTAPAAPLATIEEAIQRLAREFTLDMNSNLGDVEDDLNGIQSNFRVTTNTRGSLLKEESTKLVLEELNQIQLILADARQDYEEQSELMFFDNLNPIVTTAVGTGLVIWLLHASQVAAAVLSTASAWVQLDPLTVLQGAKLSEEPASAEEMLFDTPQGQNKAEVKS